MRYKLKIETGRHIDLPRLRALLPKSKVEVEEHFLTKCLAYATLRAQYFMSKISLSNTSSGSLYHRYRWTRFMVIVIMITCRVTHKMNTQMVEKFHFLTFFRYRWTRFRWVCCRKHFKGQSISVTTTQSYAFLPEKLFFIYILKSRNRPLAGSR